MAQEETREKQLRREQALVERELRKFEQDMQKYRPKCCGPSTCSKKTMANSSDEDFWKVPSRVKVRLTIDNVKLNSIIKQINKHIYSGTLLTKRGAKQPSER